MICLDFGIYFGKTVFFSLLLGKGILRYALAMKDIQRVLLVFWTSFDCNWSGAFGVWVL